MSNDNDEDVTPISSANISELGENDSDFSRLSIDTPTATITSSIQYTRSSMKDLVQAVAHTLAYFSDKDHPGLQEPRNVKRQVPGTGVLVQPRFNHQENLVAFRFFNNNHQIGITFDFEVYEQIGDRYVVNLLKKLTEQLKTTHRPSDEQLKQLSTRFMTCN